MDQPFASFSGALAIVTGSGDGMGRELCLALMGQGCSVAHCEVVPAKLQETQRICEAAAVLGAKSTAHIVDVAVEAQLLGFAHEVAENHDYKGRRVVLFNNAGVAESTGMSIFGDRQSFERIFNVSWNGVYFSTRAFLPLLLESANGYIVNTSSVCGFWASAGFLSPTTSYSAAKFAVKGFTEALITDFRLNAPHLRAAVVMPGHIGTGIADANTFDPAAIRADSLKRIRAVERLRGTPDYDALQRSGRLLFYAKDLSTMSDEALAKRMSGVRTYFRTGGLSAADAAKIIIDGVRRGDWRILVGEDAADLDTQVREKPENAYSAQFSVPALFSPPAKL